jgi:hypothetical protein
MDAAAFRGYSAGANYNYRVARSATVHIGYSQRLANRRSLAADLAESHGRIRDIDLGLAYSRPLSLSRRTTLTFGSGSSIVPVKEGSRLEIQGTAALIRELGRTWRAELTYARELRFAETLDEPLLSHAVAVQVSGNPFRRVNLGVSTSLRDGRVGFEAGDGGYASYRGSARAQWNINKAMAAYADSSYYGHDFGGDVRLPVGFPRRTNRYEVRVGLTASVSFLR